MNDPHIETLYYNIRHAEGVDYDKAHPLGYETPGFTVRIENGHAQVTMKSHHASEEAARSEVEPLLRAWELTAALQFQPGDFEFVYERAQIIDRKPAPGGIILAGGGALSASLAVARGRRTRSAYPDPPRIAIARDADVDLMFDRFCRYRRGGTTLPDAANFCLTALELNAGGRKAAARNYSVATPVLNKIGDLAANKGGNEARKASGAVAEFTPAERQWLEEAIKRLILRAAEVAGNPSTSLPQITMAHLPPLP